MRRGVTLSLLLHLALGLFVLIELPSFVMPEKEVKMMNIKIASVPSKVIKNQPEAKAKMKKVYSQQSSAPKYAPKKKKQKEVKKPKHKTKVLKTSKKKKKPKKVIKKKKRKVKKKVPKKQVKKAQKKNHLGTRPEKLDKTSKKKNVIKSDNKKDRKKKVEEDDFLSTLNFIDELEKEQKGSVKGEQDAESGQVFDADQLEIAKIRKLIESNWRVTAGASKLNKRKSVIKIELERDGSIKRMRIEKSSGYAYFDSSLRRAVRKSIPIPIPPGKYEIYKTLLITFSR